MTIAGPGGFIGLLPKPKERWTNHRGKLAKQAGICISSDSKHTDMSVIGGGVMRHQAKTGPTNPGLPYSCVVIQPAKYIGTSKAMPFI